MYRVSCLRSFNLHLNHQFKSKNHGLHLSTDHFIASATLNSITRYNRKDLSMFAHRFEQCSDVSQFDR